MTKDKSLEQVRKLDFTQLLAINAHLLSFVF